MFVWWTHGARQICTAAEAGEAQMVETAVLICVCVCVPKNVREGERDSEREEEEKVHPSVCGVKLALPSAQYFGTLV